MSEIYQVISLSEPRNVLESKVREIVSVFPDVVAPLYHFHNLLFDENMEVMENWIFTPVSQFTTIRNYLKDKKIASWFLDGTTSKDQLDDMLNTIKKKEAIKFRIGDSVKIIDGVYKNLNAVITDINGSNVTVSYELFRGQHTAHVLSGQIEHCNVHDCKNSTYAQNYMDAYQDKLAIVLDGNNVFYRNSSVHKKTYREEDGLFIGAASGFYFTLLKLKMLYPEAEIHTVFGCDFDDYNRHHKTTPKDVKKSFGYNLYWVKRWLNAIGFPCYDLPDKKGRDVLGSLANKLLQSKENVYIFSTDSSLFQLATDRIYIFQPRNSKSNLKVYSDKEILEYFNVVSTDKIDWLMSVLGDGSNIQNASRWTFNRKRKKIHSLKNIVECSIMCSDTLDEFKQNLVCRNSELQEFVDVQLDANLDSLMVDTQLPVDVLGLQDFDEQTAQSLLQELSMFRELDMFSRTSKIYQGLWI